jgi:hypothetical protein
MSSLVQKRKRNDPLEQEPTALPLQDVVICLSGFTHEVKNELHQLIESLGGKYVEHAILNESLACTVHSITIVTSLTFFSRFILDTHVS